MMKTKIIAQRLAYLHKFFLSIYWVLFWVLLISKVWKVPVYRHFGTVPLFKSRLSLSWG